MSALTEYDYIDKSVVRLHPLLILLYSCFLYKLCRKLEGLAEFSLCSWEI